VSGTHAASSKKKPAAELAARLAEVAGERDKATAERDAYKRLYLETLAQCRKLELGITGRGRERDLGDPSQVTMSLLGLMTGGAVSAPAAPVEPSTPPATQTIAQHERAKPTGRKPLPEKLPRVEIEVLPPEVQARGLDAFEKIGEDVSETIERRRASLVVVRTKRGKFVAKDRDLKVETQVHQGAPLELPIERGLAGPGLLADTIVDRWEDHLPLHRLERRFGREGLELSRSTICDWHLDLANLVQPLLEAMWQDAFAAPYLCIDATGVLVQQKEKCRNAHFFVVASPERHVLFGYSPKHNAAAVDALLDGYEGTLVADAHAVYDHLYADGKVVEAGCWAHTRRYYFKSLGSDPMRARRALELIGKLFAVERALGSAPPEEKLRVRQREALPIVEEFEAWCDAEALVVLDQTPISKAIGYARNQRVALRRFLDDGRLPIHNNWSERELRREAVGRRNWLFVGSDEGGEANATFVSLIASCRLHGLDPAEYLRDLLCLLPGWSQKRVIELSPLHWRATVAREEVQQALAANVYRRVALGELQPAVK
jgi:transposase